MHVVGVLALAGLEYGVIKQVNRLDAERFAPSICCLYSRAEETRSVLAARVPVYELHHEAGRNRRLVARLAGLLRLERVDIVHSHNWTTYYPTVLAARLARVPIVVHGEHGRETAERSDRRGLAKRLLGLGVSRFVAVSSDLASELVQFRGLRLERVAYIPNGVDLTRFHPGLRGRARGGDFGFPPDARIAVIIGGIRPVKDHATLLRAFATVIARLPAARLLIVGTDHGRGLQDELGRLTASLGLEHAVRFAGVRHDTPDLLALSHVYVNSSVSEGMSNTILEAMAAGRPVVATSVGGNCELVLDGETGFLVPAGDPAAIARRIDEILGDPELASRMGQAGRARVERRHRMERMVEEYEYLYLDLWERRRLRRGAFLREAPKRLIARGAWAAWTLLAGDRLRGPRLPILRYRRVLPLARTSAYPLQEFVTPRDVFHCQMAHLARRHHVLPLGEALRLLREGTLPPRAVAVTLEGGYRDTYDEAWPILRRCGIPATLFLVVDALDLRHRLWWDDIAEAVDCLARGVGQARDLDSLPAWAQPALQLLASGAASVAARQLVAGLERASPRERTEVHRQLVRAAGVAPEDAAGLMMPWDEARELTREGMTIGTYTQAYARLDEITEEEAVREVSQSVARLSGELRTRVRWLAHPAGRSLEGSEQILARAGIEAALTEEPGLNAPGGSPYALRTLDAGALSLDGGFDPAVFDAGIARIPGSFSSAALAKSSR